MESAGHRQGHSADCPSSHRETLRSPVSTQASCSLAGHFSTQCQCVSLSSPAHPGLPLLGLWVPTLLNPQLKPPPRHCRLHIRPRSPTHHGLCEQPLHHAVHKPCSCSQVSPPPSSAPGVRVPATSGGAGRFLAVGGAPSPEWARELEGMLLMPPGNQAGEGHQELPWSTWGRGCSGWTPLRPLLRGDVECRGPVGRGAGTVRHLDHGRPLEEARTGRAVFGEGPVSPLWSVRLPCWLKGSGQVPTLLGPSATVLGEGPHGAWVRQPRSIQHQGASSPGASCPCSSAG